MGDASCYNTNGDSVVLMNILDGEGFTKPVCKTVFAISHPQTRIYDNIHPKRYVQESTPELWQQAMVVNALASSQ